MSNAPKRYDLVVVGASFAGLVAARTAAMRGLEVAVLEAKPDAGARVATSGILVKEAAEEIDVPHHLTRRVHGVRLYAPSLRHVDLFAPGYFFLTTDTAALLRWLAREAMRAGATILYRTRFTGAERAGGVFRFGQPNIEARYLLGADGARSRVAACFALGRNRRFLIGVEHAYDGLDADPRFLHCFLHSGIAPGYLAWAAPGPRVWQAGLAVGHGYRPAIARFTGRTEALFAFSRAGLVERRAGRIPCGGMVRPWAAPGVMLVGDAAGMVSPLTGGGIRLAFRFARRAAHAIADHLLHLGPPPETVLAPELPGFVARLGLRRVLDRALPDWLLEAGFATPLVQVLARRIYFHRRGSPGMSFADFETRIGDLAARAERPADGGRLLPR